MKSVLAQLYEGEFTPRTRFKPIIEEYHENRGRAHPTYDSFLEKLPDNLKGEFDDILDSQLDLLPLELEQDFIDGFRLGARLMMEVLT